jgi:hypothetical protein
MLIGGILIEEGIEAIGPSVLTGGNVLEIICHPTSATSPATNAEPSRVLSCPDQADARADALGRGLPYVADYKERRAAANHICNRMAQPCNRRAVQYR